MQTSLVDLIVYLGASPQRSKIVAVGAVLPAPLQSQFRCRHIALSREEVPDNLTLTDIGDLSDTELIELAGPDSIVVCKSIGKLKKSVRSRLLSAAAHWFEQNALIIHFSPVSDELFISNPEVDAFGQQIGFSPLHVGDLPAIGSDGQRQVVALYDSEVQNALKASVQGMPPPLAIVSTFNEEDVIKEVVEDLIEQGCDLVVLDNWSTDKTWEILHSLQLNSAGRLSIERFPENPIVQSSWANILARKEEIAVQHAGRWILHSDADELRRSPFAGANLARAMHIAQIAGATRINFTVLNFCPVDAGPFIPGTLNSAFKYFQFASHPSYFAQRKAWLQGSDRVNLRKSGGHCADFKDAIDFRYKFWLKHFPIRSMSHGRTKIYRQRAQRWSKAEQELGWHVHYNNMPQDTSFVWPAEQLQEYQPNTFHKLYGLTIMASIAEQDGKPFTAAEPFEWRNRAIDEQYELIKATLHDAEVRIGDIKSEMVEQAELLTAAEGRSRGIISETAERAQLLTATEERVGAKITQGLEQLSAAEGRFGAQIAQGLEQLSAAEGRFGAQIAQGLEQLSAAEGQIGAQIAHGIEFLTATEGRIRTEIAERTELLNQAESQIREMNSQIAERTELHKKLTEAEARITESALEIAALRNSRSWRMTAPIRWVTGSFRSAPKK